MNATNQERSVGSIKDRAVELTSNILSRIQNYELIALGMFGPVGNCMCHSADTCSKCISCKRAHRMTLHVMARWKKHLFQLHADACQLEEDADISGEVTEYIKYYIDHPGVSYKEWLTQKEVAEILTEMKKYSEMPSINDIALNSYDPRPMDLPLPFDKLSPPLRDQNVGKTVSWHPDVQSGEWDDSMIAFVPDEPEVDYLDMDPVDFYEMSGDHLIPRSKGQWLYMFSDRRGDSVLHRYVRAKEVEYPHLWNDMVSYLEHEVNIRFRFAEVITLSELIEKARRYLVVRLSALISNRLRQGDRSIVRAAPDPQSGVIHGVNSWATRTMSRPGPLAFMQFMTSREFRVESSTIVDFIENLAMFAQDCSMAQTKTQYLFCFSRFIKQQFGISLLQTAHAWISAIVEEYVVAVQLELSRTNTPHPDTQAGFADFMSSYKEITQSSLWEKFTKLSVLLGSLAVGYFTGEGITASKVSEITLRIYNGLKATEIVGQVMETIMAIYNKCIPVLMGKEKFYSIFQGLGDGRQLDLDIAHFITQSGSYVAGTPAPDDPVATTLMVQGLIIIKKLEAVLAKCYNGRERESVRKTLVNVTMSFNALSLKHSNIGVREKPYSMSIFGGTSAGKTCLSMQVIVMLQRALKLPCGEEFIYRVDPEDDFFSCLKVTHNSYLMDDAGNTKVDHAKVIVSEPIIAIANNAPKAANMADLSSKGVIPIKPSILAVTTNVRGLHAAEYSVNPSAVLRRFECHITMSVKEQYATKEGVLLDDVDPMSVGFDVWNFSVHKYLPGPMNQGVQGMGHFVVRNDHEGNPLSNVSFETMCRFLVVDAKNHKLRQDRLVNQIKTAHVQPYCECGLPAIACNRCVPVVDQPHVQSGAFGRVKTVFALRDVYKNPYLMPYLKGESVKLFLLWALEAWWLSYLLNNNFVLCILVASALLYALHVHMRVRTYQLPDVPENLFSSMVEQARTRLLGQKEAIFVTISTLTAVYGAYKLTTMFSNDTEVQGSLPSRPVVIDVGKMPSPWVKPELSDLPVNSLTVTSTGRQLCDVLTPKLSVLMVYDGKDINAPSKGEFCVTFPVCTNFWITPLHIVEKSYTYVRVESKSEDKTNYCHSAFREGAYKQIGDTDYALLYMPNKGDQLNILRFFPSKEDFVGGKVSVKDTPSRLAYLVREEKELEGKTFKVPVRYQSGVRITSQQVTPNGTKPYWGGVYQFPVATQTGLCGSVIVTEGSGPFIAGLHSAGRTGTNDAYYCTIMREDIEKCVTLMTADDTPMVQGASMSSMDLNFANMPFQHSIHPKCDFQYMERAEVDIIGSNTANVRRYTSKVEQTAYSDRVSELLGLQQEHGKPALMNHWYPGRVWSEACANPKPVEMKYLTLAYNDLRCKIMEGLEKIPNAKEQIYVMDDIANTSGVDGKKGLYKMNYQASAGIPYQKPKSNYVKPSDFVYEGITVPVELTEEMKADVKRMEDDLKKGRRVYTPHRANRKDEAIKLGKAKVRIFSGTSMPYLFLMRKYFLSLSVFMQEHPELFESAVGINCFSREWTRLYTYIVMYGDERIIAGDYEKYDQYVANMLTYAAFKILLIVARWAGFDDEDITVMIGLMTETCSPLYECDGSWYIFAGSTPSGHSLTVVINGLVNSLYVRIAFYVKRPDGSTVVFSCVVAFMSYGDDNIMSVDASVEWFTHTSYQSALARYGLNYTMADKTGESVPYVSMKDATFLKRSWSYSEEYGRYKCPLDMKSISKMLHTMLVSGAVSKQQQLADILRSANQEFFMYDRPTFEKAHESLAQIAKEFELCHFMTDGVLPNGEALDAWYKEIE